MVYYLLCISAKLENLTNLEPRGGCDDPNYPYFFRLKCENCGEISCSEGCVILSKEVPNPMGRGTVNMVQKCNLCERMGTIKLIPGYGRPLTIEKSQNELYTKLMLFDCSGFEPKYFSFAYCWKAQSRSGKTYDISLSAGDYAEYYDEIEKCPLVVSNLRAYFGVVRKRRR